MPGVVTRQVSPTWKEKHRARGGDDSGPATKFTAAKGPAPGGAKTPLRVTRGGALIVGRLKGRFVAGEARGD